MVQMIPYPRLPPCSQPCLTGDKYRENLLRMGFSLRMLMLAPAPALPDLARPRPSGIRKYFQTPQGNGGLFIFRPFRVVSYGSSIHFRSGHLRRATAPGAMHGVSGACQCHDHAGMAVRGGQGHPWPTPRGAPVLWKGPWAAPGGCARSPPQAEFCILSETVWYHLLMV